MLLLELIIIELIQSLIDNTMKRSLCIVDTYTERIEEKKTGLHLYHSVCIFGWSVIRFFVV